MDEMALLCKYTSAQHNLMYQSTIAIAHHVAIPFCSVFELRKKYNDCLQCTCIMMVLTGSMYSLIYCKSVSCKCLEDGSERKLSDSVVGRKVAFHCDLLMVLLHESKLGFPLILYQAT